MQLCFCLKLVYLLFRQAQSVDRAGFQVVSRDTCGSKRDVYGKDW